VHLLLAYPLFVVVVGVDPRWLLHSLEEHVGAFRTSINAGHAEWRSTSLDYLEKIFQIPYTLRPMSADGFKRLVDNLSASAPASINTDTNMPDEDLLSSPPLASQDETAREELLYLNPRQLELDERERIFMTRLHYLIPTPRAAKRFVNVYRLIRASIVEDHELRWFLEAREFIAVQVLLALVTGVPGEASEILSALLSYPAYGAWSLRWWELVDKVIAPRADRPEWQRLALRLVPLREDDEIPQTCEGFRKWADDVARYSFYSGRILLGTHPPQSMETTS
jgi:hypothetical protein